MTTPVPNRHLATTVSPPKASALALMASRLNLEPSKVLAVLKETVFKNASDNELAALVVVCNEYHLNPLLKEIYAFPAKGGGIVPVVSIDGWVSMVNRHPAFDGMEFDFEHRDNGDLVSVTCCIHRKDRSRPVSVTEFLSECRRNTEPWKMEHRMLRHKALKECARYAFGFSGVTDEDEAIDIAATITATEEAEPARLPARKPRNVVTGATKPATEAAEAPEGSIHDEMDAFLEVNGFSLNMLQKWGEESGNIENATSFATVHEMPENDLRRILINPEGLRKQLEMVKGGMAR